MQNFYHMIDISDKVSSRRVAIARGKIYVGAHVFELIHQQKMLKGDPIRLAEIAAILGAKQTSNLLPLCHPIGLEKVEFFSELIPEQNAVQVYCITTITAKTGVEMEALAGVSAGLLTIYDLSKISEPSLKISDLELVLKIGGKSGLWLNPQITDYPQWLNQYLPKIENLAPLTFASITLSDRATNGQYPDLSGQLLQDNLIKHGASSLGYHLIADDSLALTQTITELIKTKQPQLIITTGGTGIGPRDITPETILSLGGREITGLGELLRLFGSKFTQFSWGSRSVAIELQRTLIIALPGSTKAISQGLECLLPLIPHLIKMINGAKHD